MKIKRNLWLNEIIFHVDVSSVLFKQQVRRICPSVEVVNTRVLFCTRCFMLLDAGTNRADQTEISLLES